MMEKTFSTFHASNVLLEQQYREKGFKKYSELIFHLLVAETNSELLLKNHENRPTGSEPLPEVNEAYAHHDRRGKGRGPNRGRGRGRDVDVIVVAIMVKNVILILALIIHQIKRKKKG